MKCGLLSNSLLAHAKYNTFARTSEENLVVCILDRTNSLFYFIFLVTALLG